MHRAYSLHYLQLPTDRQQEIEKILSLALSLVVGVQLTPPIKQAVPSSNDDALLLLRTWAQELR